MLSAVTQSPIQSSPIRPCCRWKSAVVHGRFPIGIVSKHFSILRILSRQRERSYPCEIVRLTLGASPLSSDRGEIHTCTSVISIAIGFPHRRISLTMRSTPAGKLTIRSCAEDHGREPVGIYVSVWLGKNVHQEHENLLST